MMATLEKSTLVELVTDADDEIKKIRSDALAALASLGDEPAARGARILVSFLVLQTYDEAEDALDMLDEAVGAVRVLFPAKKRGRSKKAEPTVDEDAPPPVDALLDVLVALLDKGSADLRTLANQVFGMLVPVMTASAVEHLVAQLEQSGAAEGADDDEEHEHGPDCNHSDEEDEDEDEDEDESDAESTASDDTDANAEVDPDFRRRVAEALKVSGVLDEKEDGEGDDNDSDDESVWDDEQMMKVDEQLAAVFKQQASSKKADLKHAATEALHFKNRVLDFFDVFLRRPTPLALALLLPLLHVVRGGGELGNKAAGILRTRLKSAALSPSSEKEELERAGKILSEIHGLARKAPSAEFSGLCSAASLFAARVAPAQALEEYKTTLADFVTRKHSGVHAPFLQEYARRNAGKAWPLASELLSLLGEGKAANAYRHTQAYALLGALLSQAPALVKAGEITSAQAEEVIKGSMGDVYSVLEAAAAGGEWKADRLKDAAKFALVVGRTARLLDVGAACDEQRLKAVLEAVKGGRTKEMKSVHGLLGQLAAVLGKKEEKKGKGKGKKAQVNGGAAAAEAEAEEPKPVTGKRKAAATKVAKGRKKAKAE
jgi:DNA polymerase phi